MTMNKCFACSKKGSLQWLTIEVHKTCAGCMQCILAAVTMWLSVIMYPYASDFIILFSQNFDLPGSNSKSMTLFCCMLPCSCM